MENNMPECEMTEHEKDIGELSGKYLAAKAKIASLESRLKKARELAKNHLGIKPLTYQESSKLGELSLSQTMIKSSIFLLRYGLRK